MIFTAAKGQRGTINKSATVTCNDNDRSNFGLVLKGTIYPTENPDSLKPVTLSQSHIRWDPTTPQHETKLIVKNVSEQPLRLALVASYSEFLSVEVPKDEIKPGKTKEIKIKAAKGFTGTDFKKSFTFECSDSAKSRFTVPVELAAATPMVTPTRPDNPPPPVGKQRAVDSTHSVPPTTGPSKTH